MDSFDFTTFYYELRRFWWLILIGLAAGAAFGFWNSTRQPAVFTSESKMLVSGKINLQAGTSYSEEAQDFLGTQATIMQSREVRSRAEKSLAAAGKKPAVSWADVSVAFIPRTTIFLLKATGLDPAYTQAFLQECMKQYINLRREFRLQRSDDTASALEAELVRVQNEMNAATQELNEFQRKFNVISLEDEQTADTAYLGTLRKRVADLRLQKSIAVTGGLDPNSAGSSIPLGSTEENTTTVTVNQQQGPQERLLTAKQDLTLLQAERQRLLANLRAEHPKIKQLDIKISEAQKLVTFLTSQISDNNKDRIASIDREMEGLKQEISQKESRLFELNSHLADYRNLKSRADNARSTYDKLTASVENVDVGKKLDQDNIAILENATRAAPENKSLMVDVAQASLLGLVLSTGTILLLARLSKRFHTIEAVQRHLGLPIFGKILRDRWAAGLRTILDCDRNHLDFAESFRNLRSGLLHFPGAYAPKRCFAVTSAIPNEGKSTIAVNLAIALAATNSRTLLVDADMRRGKLHQLLKVQRSPGLSELITNQSLLEEVVHPTIMPNLMLLPTGQPIANTSEQLLRYGVDELIRSLTEHFDYVIIDTPPVLAADDAVTIAAKTDWAMFLVRLGYSSPVFSKRALDELKSRQIHVPGIVVNSVPRGLTAQSYYNHYFHPRLETRSFLELTEGGGQRQ
jgi:succinoglycan biosynthesis transport protein ExoP